jgi:hypothetical protein
MLLDDRNRIHEAIESVVDHALGDEGVKVETGGGSLMEQGHVDEEGDGYWVCLRLYIPRRLV